MTVSEKDGPVREEETPGVVSRSQAKEGLQEWESVSITESLCCTPETNTTL